MAKLASIATDFVRKIFARERQNSELAISTKELARAQTRNSFGHGTGFDLTGNGGIGDVLGNDRRLLHRYADYEEMDEYGDISACLDIYADDATQTDSEADHTLWVESKDQAVRDDLTDVFQKRIKTDENAWEMMRTLCKYGNDFEEIVIGENGVVALNYLPPATCRRVDSDRGDFLGVVQSFSSDLEINAKQFEAMKTKNGAMVNPDGNMAAFEDWRVAHMRLRSKNRESLYGWSAVEAARWIWRRLMLLEDAVLVYKLCLRGDTKVWTPDGRKAIRDLEDGDEVYSYGEDSNLKKTRVVSKKHNGKDVLYRVRSAHRELYANATHPILVETILQRGVNEPWARRLDYVEVQDLDPNIHRLVTPSKGDDLCELVSLAMPEVGQKARLSSRALEAGVKMEAGIKHLQDTCGMQSNLIKKFFAGEYEVVAHTAEKVLLANGTPLHYLDVRDDWGGVKKLSLPDAITPDFAQWFGFMIGDGFASECAFKQRDKTYFLRKVGFAAGDKEDINQKYKVLFESFFGEVKFERDKRSKHECVGKYIVSSKALYEFMILNGYIPGAHNKRIPEWVFRSPVSVREAFLAGLADADGHITEGSVSPIRNRVKYSRVVLELCNRALVDDVRELAMQTGYVVGRVRSRIRKGGREILENGFPLSDRVSYSVAWSYERQPITEPLWEVEEVETDDIWDIGVEANEHNFVANGIVVHNSRSPSRYAFYVDVGNLPRQEAERVIEQVKNKVKKKKFVNPRSGKLDLKFNPLPVSHDSKIPLLDGRTIAISEMAREFEDGKKNWVYSINKDTGNVVPGEVEWVGQTRENSSAVKVTFDDGSWVKMAPDHPVMRRDRSYVMAKDLGAGDRVMPFYRRISNKEKGDSMDKYEMVYDPEDTVYKYTHRVVSDHFGIRKSGEVTHHKSFDQRNNNPEQLEVMDIAAHVKVHVDAGGGGGKALRELRRQDKDLDERIRVACRKNMIAYNKSDEKRRKTSELNRKYNTKQHIIDYNGSEQHRQDNEIRSHAMRAMWADEDRKKQVCENMKIKFPDSFIQGVMDLIEANPGISAQKLADILNNQIFIEILNKGNTRKIKRITRDTIWRMGLQVGCETFSELKESALCSNNHKVVSVEYIDPCDHFCMTVKDWHNFALVADGGGKVPGWSSGVFVKNSFDEDFFLAMRDGQEKTRIDVLNGPSYQQVEDVQYFLSKLYAALKVPRAYLGYDENMPSKATLCLSGDTKILLLDGTSPTIKELVKRGESFWVYSIDENKNVVPGLASAPRLTRNGAQTVNVELSNGEVIVCTPEHPIMNRFGNYVGASELMPGDSLMPLHRRMHSGKADGYEEVYDPGDNRWRYTHNMVNDALFRGEESEMVCHHKNFDRGDNRPTNLSFVSLDEHRNIQASNTYEELSWSDVRVVSVKYGETMDTYDLTVDDYHNFAISQGVFVHNSQEDVRFARTVLRIQSEFINGMRKIARVHLATRRIDPAAVDFQIKMAVPSAIFELGQMEVRRARADLASQMERHVSSYFLLSNIYGLSDDEIAAITKQKKEEQKSMGGGMGGGFESVDNKGNVLVGSGLSDRELSDGNREHEKAIEEMLHKEIAKANTPLGRQMKETLALVREIASATSGVNW